MGSDESFRGSSNQRSTALSDHDREEKPEKDTSGGQRSQLE